MNYEVPEEYEFIYEGFGISDSYDHDEGIISYVFLYENSTELTFTHSPCMGQYINVRCQKGEELVFDFHQSGVKSINFGGWKGESTVDVLFKDNTEVKIFYKPKPRLVFRNED